jgi:voltage-gated potassium channel
MSPSRENGLREKLRKIIFESNTRAGKLFDEVLIICIFASVIAVMLDSVSSIAEKYGRPLYVLEWFFTIIFTIEYILRLATVSRPLKYATSFFGVVDLLTVIPTYLDLLFPGARFLLVIRILRVLRIFRVLKLTRYMGEAEFIVTALRASMQKITVFLFAILTVVVILGSMMYIVEGTEHGFHNIPLSVYWAIVTLTTVGYGDMSPQTPLGQAISVVIMIVGYSIIAVPTGIVGVEFSRAFGKHTAAMTTKACPGCGREGHESDASYCKYCGEAL